MENNTTIKHETFYYGFKIKTLIAVNHLTVIYTKGTGYYEVINNVTYNRTSVKIASNKNKNLAYVLTQVDVIKNMSIAIA
jgi:hypothetical protein